MADIDVQMRNEHEDGYSFDVSISEGAQHQRHEVTLSKHEYNQDGASFSSPDDFVRRVVEILLEHRSMDELDLQSMDVAELKTFYPELRQELQRRR